MVSKKQAQTEARRRAREAKARRDAELATREKKITEATDVFYVAVVEMEEAQQTLDAATDRRNEAVRSLAELDGIDDDAIADLTGLDARDVAKIKKTPGRQRATKSATDSNAETSAATTTVTGAGDTEGGELRTA